METLALFSNHTKTKSPRLLRKRPSFYKEGNPIPSFAKGGLGWIFCMLIAISLPGCKINLSIFGSGTVQTQSGTINCTSDGTTQGGDCTQTYNVDANNVACTPGDPNCTVVTASQDVQETLVPTAPQDNTFKGFDGGCIGAGPCTLDIREVAPGFWTVR